MSVSLITTIFITLLILYIVLAVLKRNYTRLCHCLPQDYMKTINKLKELLSPSDEYVQKLIDIAAANFFNETVVGMLMTTIKTDAYALNFCDMMEKLCYNESSRMHIEMFRKGNFIKIISYAIVCAHTHIYLFHNKIL